jgi:cyclic beta-1,2-glucan synthetase
LTLTMSTAESFWIANKTPTEPIRGEVYGVERLEEHARAIAQQARVLRGIRRGKRLLPRLQENGARLNHAQREFTDAHQAGQTLPPAAEWLLDNYYIVETQLNRVRHDLSANYYRELPKLADGALAGYPRVFSLALELIAHTDSRLNQEVVERFVRAYQQVTPLSTGEIWAIAIMLRVLLIENLRRLVDEALEVLTHHTRANQRADRLLAAAKMSESAFLIALAELVNTLDVTQAPFMLQLMQRLRDQDPAVAPALQWLERKMRQANIVLEDYIRDEHQRRAVNRVSIGNVITSMRLLDALDWHSFFENVSLVEHTLQQDPSGAYAQMDFASRDRYRHVVETLAKHSLEDEVTIARRAIALAAQTSSDPTRAPDARRQHVGYFLIDDGLPALQAAVQYHPPLGERLAAQVRRHATAFYLGTIALLTLLLVAAAMTYASAQGGTPAMNLLVALVTLIPLSVVAVGTLNWTLTVELKPETLPKLELKEGIPLEFRTMVVVPALITSAAGLEFLLEHLELRFLANRDENLHFALLGDFADAPQEQMPEDAALIDAATQGIQRLNAKYARADAFYFFHRRRQWNAGEGCWMGWERKRGKLEEFNQLLRGATDTSFYIQIGDTKILPHIRYVITLDADTELPMQVARRLVGTIAHPLNRAVLDPKTRHVVAGYGIIQPRVDVMSPASARSRFAQLFTGDTGLDPYSSVVSNVYQDLFGRGVYIGKAIYDVDAMRAALRNRFPENLLLSHDLLEGAFARVGFASDIELLEDFPSGYDVYMQRQHRWVRGDWQITDWLFPRVRDRAGNIQHNPLPLIERWKIFDNLRRSLVPPAVIVMLLAGWTILPGERGVWTLLALLTILFPFVRSALIAIGDRANDESWRSYLNSTLRQIWIATQRGVFTLCVLLDTALTNGDAIARVVVRRAVTHRHLLLWTSFAAVQDNQAQTLRAYIARMGHTSIAAVLILILLVVVRPTALLEGLPLVLLWFLSPSIAFLLSEPPPRVVRPLSSAARRHLRMHARRIWRFYEEFAGEQDHWLPPDNFQLEPNPIIAHRTSPTNIGLLLLATLAAYDFGYITREQFVERIARIFETLDQLERYRGHFYNWYDTTTLRPLHPQYISTVDSGNLAACLIALKQGCLELRNASDDTARALRGAQDTLWVLETQLAELDTHAAKALQADVARLRQVIDAFLAESASPLFDYLERVITKLERDAHALHAPHAAEARFWAQTLARQLRALEQAAQPISAETRAQLEQLAARAEEFVAEMEFDFLYDSSRHLFTIGLHVTDNRLDSSYYDLLASEARLTSFLLIARGALPARHWFYLTRPLVHLRGKAVLLSWGGTMFEYLMPALLLRDFTPSLLQQTESAVVEEQIAYAARHHIPWGISESGFYAFDYQFNYQYRAFGVPVLGLKRETIENLVIAPYATFLALPYAPHAASRNLEALARWGGAGTYGFYEALDFTPSRLPKGQRVAVVRSYMAHHQAMSLLALDNYFHDEVMRARFHREPVNAAAELLLQERIPRHAPLLQATKEEKPILRGAVFAAPSSRREYSTPHTPVPRAHLLSNGEYTVMVTNAGSGYSAVNALQVTRWAADTARDALGAFCYIQERATGRVWSNTYQPTCAQPETYHVTFAPEKVEFSRRDDDIETKTEIFVSPEWNAEIRRVTLSNRAPRARVLELTSYAEVVLAAARGDAMHPAFSKLFVESEFVPRRNLLLLKRRPRAADQPTYWVVHSLFSETPGVTVREYETDRARFIGRGRTLADPAALYAPLSNTTGAALDPVMSLRTRVKLDAGASVTVSFITAVADAREKIIALCDEYLDERDLERAQELARARSDIEMRHLGITADQVNLFQRFASRVLFPEVPLRAPADVMERNTQGQSALWAYGISGDYPIVLLRVDDREALPLVRQALLAHEYWRLHNFQVDLVILDEHPISYADGLGDALRTLIDTSLSRPWLDKPGGIFVRRREHMAPDDFILLQTIARVIVRGGLGELGDQIRLSSRHVPMLGISLAHRAPTQPATPIVKKEELEFFNGLGGYDAKRREYVITLRAGEWTPTPWTNVLANPNFGCLVTSAGLGSSWSINSQQNRLTPWCNDPVSETPGEAIYLQDMDAYDLWTPTPLPIREAEPYTIRHGVGYSAFEHTSHGLAQTLRVTVPQTDSIKLIQLTLRNLTMRVKHVRATYYAEWVLGVLAADDALWVQTEFDAETHAIFARQLYSAEFHARVAFAACAQPITAWTTNRTEFIGRNGSLALPAALARHRHRLAQQSGVGLGCAALQTEIELRPGEEREIVFLLGQGADPDEARALIAKYRAAQNVQRAIETTAHAWAELLNTIQAQTPDPALDVMLNHWLLYQALACRVWGRSAFYQSSGAYGFRDQLQDVMAMVLVAPEIAREHILRAAAHQFPEGDVMHWWHEISPTASKGVRTRISDDPLWLPYVTEHYVRVTGDVEILDAPIPFVKMPLLEAHQDEIYGEPEISAETASLYEHCLRALDFSLRFGEHGLPLMGTGDWNDGMNRVGAQGKGESVWLGWFLYSNLVAFASRCETRGDVARAQKYRAHAEELQCALNEHAWDGEWYRRAYFDDGTPLGSRENAECQIDAIAQAWSVISNAAPPERQAQALRAVEHHLVCDQEKIIRLLTPPFDHMEPNPGYIQGYVPGIRENGGQYTHGALWVVLAYVLQGNGDRAWELFQMLNPLNHAQTMEQVNKYQVDPYVVAADVYTHPQHLGRGGWTWYTGSAGWMYRIGVEYILGLQRRGASLNIAPCIPRAWQHYRITYRLGKTQYEIEVENPNGVNRGVAHVEMDGKTLAEPQIPLRQDEKIHHVRVVLGDK